MDDLADRLTNAEQRVVTARRIVARHRAFVANEVAKGHPVQDATKALKLFLGTLKTFEVYENILRGEAGRLARSKLTGSLARWDAGCYHPRRRARGKA